MIEIEFTYNIPDIFGTTLTEQKLNSSETYIGPEFFYVCLDQNDKVTLNKGIVVKDDSIGDEFLQNWCDECDYVLIDANKYPLAAYLLADAGGLIDNDSTQDEAQEPLNEKHYYLEGETEPFFSHIDPMSINDIYSVNHIFYDKETQLLSVPMVDHSKIYDEEDETDFFGRRDAEIADANRLIQSGSLSQSEIILLKEYIKEFDNLEVKYADWPQHMWPTPAFPLWNDPEPGDPDYEE